jgi:hypothetical protein
MDILTKYKLYLIDKTLDFTELPQLMLCEEHLGNLGKIEKDKDVYIDGKVIYHYNSKNGDFYLSYNNIWSFFVSKFNMKYEDIQHVTSLYVEETYNLKGINTLSFSFF